jgi:hypothetical protein
MKTLPAHLDKIGFFPSIPARGERGEAGLRNAFSPDYQAVVVSWLERRSDSFRVDVTANAR